MNKHLDTTGLEPRLRQHVAALAAVPRPPGSAAHRQAQAYIQTHLRRAGFTVRAEAYGPSSTFPGLNLLTTPLPDRDDLPLVIVGAHYDSLPETPGADDNASAVAALLELAAWFGPWLAGGGSWSARLQLAAYDQEEDGLLGSRHHSEQVMGQVRAMLALEMLGYTDRRPGGQRLPPGLAGLYPDVGDFIAVVGNDAARALVENVAQSMRQVADLPVQELVVPGDGSVLPDSRRSDHASFWDRGFPAVMVTDTSFLRNPHYHEASDTPDTLDYHFLKCVTSGVALAIGHLLTEL